MASCLGQVWHGDDHGRDFGTARFEMWLENRFRGNLSAWVSGVGERRISVVSDCLQRACCRRSEAATGLHPLHHPIVQIPRF